MVSPNGGLSPLEPRSLKFPNYDKSAKAWKADDAKMSLLANTASSTPSTTRTKRSY